MATKLKQSYSAREVAALTGLTARQLQWWDAKKLLTASVASRPTPAGGYTERRYSPVDLYELSALADLRRRGFTVQRIRKILESLRAQFGIRLFDVLGDDGPITVRIDGLNIYARTHTGAYYDLLQSPAQPLLMMREERFETLGARPGGRGRRKGAKRRSRSAPER